MTSGTPALGSCTVGFSWVWASPFVWRGHTDISPTKATASARLSFISLLPSPRSTPLSGAWRVSRSGPVRPADRPATIAAQAPDSERELPLAIPTRSMCRRTTVLRDQVTAGGSHTACFWTHEEGLLTRATKFDLDYLVTRKPARTSGRVRERSVPDLHDETCSDARKAVASAFAQATAWWGRPTSRHRDWQLQHRGRRAHVEEDGQGDRRQHRSLRQRDRHGRPGQVEGHREDRH